MAKKTNTEITAKNGKTYSYYSVRRKVGMKKNKAGKWVPDYRLFYGESKKAAEAKYQEYIKAVSADSRQPLGQLAEWFIENVFRPDSSFKDGTKVLYINSFHRVFDGSQIIGRSLDELTGADIQAAISGADCKASTVHSGVKLLRLMYKYLEAQRITTDVTKGLVLPAIERKRKDQTIEVFTDSELKTFTESTPSDHRLKLLVILAINTGARIGELLALTYDDIQGDQLMINKALVEIDRISTDQDSKTHAEISETKTATSVRSVPLSASALEAVADHKKWHEAEMKKNGYKTRQIFTTESGALYFKSSVRMSFKRLCESLKIEPRGFHTFRHTFGSKLAAAGVPIQTVSKLMGHGSINVTAKYYINVPTDEKRAAIATLEL